MRRLVTFQTSSTGGTYVLINGITKAYISRGPERYISVTSSSTGNWPSSTHAERNVIARFKHNQPMVHARDFCRVAFSALDIPTIIELTINDHVTPVDLLKRINDGEFNG